MDGELDLSGQIADKKTGIAPAKQHIDSSIQSEASRTIRHLQAWHYLIVICTAFWLLFATILFLSGFYFLIVALAIIALLSVLVIALAWAFQNNI